MPTHTTSLFLLEDLEDVGKTSELAEGRANCASSRRGVCFASNLLLQRAEHNVVVSAVS